ncbi:amidohydrolase family protein [Marisediminicola senii]|uniref:cytosine deaminase n=1 Tax=Marisediminicola senii TaxID=2711233 RepID=UPI001911B158|nr:cytosine deaminase [Marisediminicola senii]
MDLPRPLSLLRRATLPDGRIVDVELAGDVVTGVRAAGTGAPSANEVDLDGYLLLTAPADPHSHLDKARSWDAIQPPMGDLMGAIESWREYTAAMDEDDVAERALAQALAMLERGTTGIRSHVDVLRGDDPLLGARAMARVRDELDGLLDLELVVLAGPDVPDEHIHGALDLGLDLVGGAPHLADDPSADLQRLLAIALGRDIGVDLHTDESLDGPATLEEFAATVRGWNRNVTAGHCVRLGTLPTEERLRVIDAIVESDIGIVANPITNLYLQGWGHESGGLRGLAPARELLSAGARFAAGADNIRDPFNPLGRSDALETAMLLVIAGHLTIDEAYAAVSDGARAVMGLPAAGAVVGARADFLAIRGGSLAEAVATAPADRKVIHAGRLVASTTVSTTVAQPARSRAAAGAAAAASIAPASATAAPATAPVPSTARD